MRNLFDIPDELALFETASIAAVPVPFNVTGSWIKGTDQGPRAIIEASQHVELFDIETDTEVYKRGIFLDRPITADSPELLVEGVRMRILELLSADRFPVILGGEHTVSVGAVQACCSQLKDLSVLHMDAHAERRNEFNGSSLSYACAAARMREASDTVVSVGIRSMDVIEKEMAQQDTIVYARDINLEFGWIARVVDALTDYVYISIDLDVFDPAFVPSTATPEPGGLDWYQVTDLVRTVVEEKTVVGFDVVELCPGENKASDFLATKLVYKLLSYVFCV